MVVGRWVGKEPGSNPLPSDELMFGDVEAHWLSKLATASFVEDMNFAEQVELDGRTRQA